MEETEDTTFGLESAVIDMAYNSLGTRFVSAHGDGMLRFWKRGLDANWMTTLVLRSAHESEQLAALSWAPPTMSPSLLASVGIDGVLAIYDVPVLAQAQGNERADGENIQLLKIQDAEAQLHCLAFSDNGVLATMGVEQVVRIYSSPDNGSRWGLQCAVELYSSGRSGLAFMPETDRVLCAGGKILMSAKEPWAFVVRSDLSDKARVACVACVAWSRKGYVALGFESGDVEIWEVGIDPQLSPYPVEDGSQHRQVHLGRSSAKIYKLSWDLSGETLACSHIDGSVRVWARLATPSSEEGTSWSWQIRDIVKSDET